MKILQERFPYRVVEKTDDHQVIEKYDPLKKKYFTMYVFGCELQMLTALEDHEYVKWLDPSNPPCYVRDCVGNY
jgi:hypothetical protein